MSPSKKIKDILKIEESEPTKTRQKTEWRDKQNLIHRLYGPAIIWENGAEEWWIRGRRHRVGAPAIIGGLIAPQTWWINGQLHREDGPAVEFKCGREFYYYEGEEIPIMY